MQTLQHNLGPAHTELLYEAVRSMTFSVVGNKYTANTFLFMLEANAAETSLSLLTFFSVCESK